MAQPEERQPATITDMIVARERAIEAVGEFNSARMDQQKLIDARIYAGGSRAGAVAVQFSVRPSKGAENLTAFFVRYDSEEHAETDGETLRTRKVTRSKPFEADGYRQRRHYFQSDLDGWYEFELEHSKDKRSTGESETLSWHLQILMDQIAKVDITETRNGLVVAQWVGGQVVPVAAEQAPVVA